MLPVSGSTRPAPLPRTRTASAPSAVFDPERFAPGETPASVCTPAAAEVPDVTLGGLLGLQEQGAAEPVADRQARRHGRAMLDALARIQARLLAGAADVESLERLAALAGDLPSAADPALQAALAQVVLRARIELTRYGFA